MTVPAVVVASLIAVSPTATADSTSGTFTVLSYNVAGLPELLSSAPTPRESSTTAIGQRLGPYDIIQVQEDFNYHAYLYAADAHPYRTPTSGGAAIGSGLNTLSSFSYDADDFERVRWDSCQLDSGDCLTPKGFTFMRVRLTDGAYVDFYNLHANAGTSSGDETSRADNLDQLTAFIQTHSAGNAVVVMGDTNTRYTRTEDTIAAFVSDNGLIDAWVQLERSGVAPSKGDPALTCDAEATTNACETVDKIMYRSSQLVTLTATAFENAHAAFLDSSGVMLSDHDPVATSFSWTQNADYQLTDQFGGPHGDYYNDIDTVPAGARVTTISLRSGSRIDRVGVTLDNGTTLTHGGTGGTASSLTLGSAEYVASAFLCQGEYNGTTRISYVQFTTDLGRTLSGGEPTSDCVTRTAPSGWQIAGFNGRSGAGVDKVGFIYTKR